MGDISCATSNKLKQSVATCDSCRVNFLFEIHSATTHFHLHIINIIHASIYRNTKSQTEVSNCVLSRFIREIALTNDDILQIYGDRESYRSIV